MIAGHEGLTIDELVKELEMKLYKAVLDVLSVKNRLAESEARISRLRGFVERSKKPYPVLGQTMMHECQKRCLDAQNTLSEDDRAAAKNI